MTRSYQKIPHPLDRKESNMQMHIHRPNAATVLARQDLCTGEALGAHYWMIYAIAASEDGPTKIGVTQSLEERLAQLQTGSWQRLIPYGYRLAIPKTGGTLRVSMAAALKEGAMGLERQAHKALKEMELWLSGEWFDISPAEALAVLDKCGSIGRTASISIAMLAGAESNAGLDASMREAHMKLLRDMAVVGTFIQRMGDGGA